MVPVFNENDVEKYFQHFEKVAVSLEWPKKMWPVLLQSALKGKAQEAYSFLCEEESFDYERVKMAILKAYELVPEVYRQSSELSGNVIIKHLLNLQYKSPK